MEYCPRPNLQVRARKEPFSVAEALRVGIQVASAVETAHRAGVLHRDIKPANILVTEYNRPALTDFGIASTTGAVTEAAGMSIPWSPPESFADPPRGGTRSDVYALGATIYTLLAGRSPFERPGERNTSADLIERIERMALPPLNRPDSPSSLQAVLDRSMAKNPDDRYPSAVALGRALQKVQIELAHSVTPIDIVEENPAAEDHEDDADGLTRVRDIVSIDPNLPNATRPSAVTEPKRPDMVLSDVPRFDRVSAPTPLVDETQQRVPTPMVLPLADDHTQLRAPTLVAPQAATAAPAAPIVAPEPLDTPQSPTKKPKGMPWWGWVAAALAVVLVVTYVWFSDEIADVLLPDPTSAPTETSAPVDVLADIVPPVTGLVGARSGDTVSFTWENAAPEEGDSFIWYEYTLSDGPGKPENTEATSVTLTGAHPGDTCIEVILKRADGRSSSEVRECIE